MAESRSMEPEKSAEEVVNDGGDNDIDILSSLPNTLLCHIMSFLPTRTSVWTMSLLSRRWRHLWKDLQVFQFYCYRLHSTPFKKFILFVNTVLHLRNFRNIHKFHLDLTFHCSDFENSYLNFVHCVKSWILDAIGPQLQHLYLYIHIDSVIHLPSFLFINCSNLLSLSLSGKISMEVKHSSLHFQSLKMLSLGTEIMDESKLLSFLSGSPKLETLQVYFYFQPAVSVTNALVPSSYQSSKPANDNFTWTYFDINEGYINLGIIGNFHTMEEAFLNVFYRFESEFVDPVLDQLLVPHDAINLRLRHSTSKCSIHAPVLNYPEFRDLHHLKFILPCFNSNLLVHVLEKCRMLQVLIIQSNKEEPPPLRTWQLESTTVSECLKSHLTYVHIEGYQGLEDELTFAEYILQNGLVLRTMLIFVDSLMDKTDKECSLKRLTNISKGSVTCQLKFDPTVSS